MENLKKNTVQYIQNSRKNILLILEKIKIYKVPFALLCGLLILGVASILRANYYYLDDWQRVSNGFRGWSNYSRYLSDYLSVLLHTERNLLDLSPFTQILAVVIMALAGFCMLHVFSENKKITGWQIFYVIPFALSPYFLQCYSYKYDAPYMAFSVLVAVLPILFRKSKLYGCFIMLGTFGMCMTYQASSGIFPMLVLFLMLHLYCNGESMKKCLWFATVSAFYYLVALIIFNVFMVKELTSYASTTMLTMPTMFTGVANNLKLYIERILYGFKPMWCWLVVGISLFFVFTSVKYSKQNKWSTVFLAISTVICAFVLSYGAYLFLKKPLFSPRALYGFGVWISLLMMPIAFSNKNYIGKGICLVLCYCFFAFSSEYGNYLALQQDYTKYTAQSISSSISKLYPEENDKQISLAFKGTTKKAPIIEQLPKEHTLLKVLTQNIFANTAYFGHFLINSYLGYETFVFTDKQLELFENLPVLEKTKQFCIYGNEKRILVEIF